MSSYLESLIWAACCSMYHTCYAYKHSHQRLCLFEFKGNLHPEMSGQTPGCQGNRLSGGPGNLLLGEGQLPGRGDSAVS